MTRGIIGPSGPAFRRCAPSGRPLRPDDSAIMPSPSGMIGLPVLAVDLLPVLVQQATACGLPEVFHVSPRSRSIDPRLFRAFHLQQWRPGSSGLLKCTLPSGCQPAVASHHIQSEWRLQSKTTVVWRRRRPSFLDIFLFEMEAFTTCTKDLGYSWYLLTIQCDDRLRTQERVRYFGSSCLCTKFEQEQTLSARCREKSLLVHSRCSLRELARMASVVGLVYQTLCRLPLAEWLETVASKAWNFSEGFVTA